MTEEERLIKDIRARLSDYRYGHSLNVAKAAVMLAEKYGGDRDKAYMAGLGHDVLKEQPRDEALKFFSDENIELTEIEQGAPKLWHAISGARYLKKNYGFTDDMCDAVRYHTTGRKDMTQLDKILFIADFISADRDYPGVDEMRKRAEVSLEYAMQEGLRFTINELSEKCVPIHPDTLACYNETIMNMNKGRK